MYKDDTILVVGQAKPSKEDAIYSLHGEFYVSFVVERATGQILDLDEMQQSIRERYFALTQKPLIACLKDAHNRYMMVTGQK